MRTVCTGFGTGGGDDGRGGGDDSGDYVDGDGDGWCTDGNHDGDGYDECDDDKIRYDYFIISVENL